MAGSVEISGTLSALPQGQITIGPLLLTATPSNLVQSTNLVLNSGANTITVPTWAAGVIIVQSPNNLVQVTLKGVTGDTGIALDLTMASVLTFPATPPASFVLTAASAGVQETTIIFF